MKSEPTNTDLSQQIDTLGQQTGNLAQQVENLSGQVGLLAQQTGDLSRQIETVAVAVAKIYEQMATKDDIAKVEERLGRIENNHVRRIENLELSAVDFRRDITKLKTHAGIE